MASTATNRPTYSSWSATRRLAGLATVTFGGAGAAPGACGSAGSQPASPSVRKSSTAGALNVASNLDFGMRFPAETLVMHRSDMVLRDLWGRLAREDVNGRDQSLDRLERHPFPQALGRDLGRASVEG